MSGKIIHNPPLESACLSLSRCVGIPDAAQFEPGTAWQCDRCEREWTVVRGSQYNESYNAWRKGDLRDKPFE